MISENITRDTFIVNAIERDVRNIYKAQFLIATQNCYLEGKSLKVRKRKGVTLAAKKDGNRIVARLQNPNFNISVSGDKLLLTNNIIKQLRFRDMKKWGNWRIYNRQVWGILYNNSLKDIKLHLGEQMRDTLGVQLQEAFKE